MFTTTRGHFATSILRSIHAKSCLDGAIMLFSELRNGLYNEAICFQIDNAVEVDFWRMRSFEEVTVWPWEMLVCVAFIAAETSQPLLLNIS